MIIEKSSSVPDYFQWKSNFITETKINDDKEASIT